MTRRPSGRLWGGVLAGAVALCASCPWPVWAGDMSSLHETLWPEAYHVRPEEPRDRGWQGRVWEIGEILAIALVTIGVETAVIHLFPPEVVLIEPDPGAADVEAGS